MYLPINPILVQFGPFSIHWYGVVMTLAIFLGALVASRFVTEHDGDGNVIWDMLLWVLIPALVGARLYFVFIQSPRGPNGLGEYLAHPIEILQIWRGGIHIYGALIFGGIALLLYLRMHKLPFARYLDGAALGLTLGQAIGRLGNFINQELYGLPTTFPWGLRIDLPHRIPPYDDFIRYPESVRFHPLFLYEMIWDAIGFVLLLWIARRFAKQLRTGDIFLLYLIWVPLGRFFIEFQRTDSWFFPGTPFNTAHILTATAVICGATFLFLRHRHAPAIQQAVESEGDQVHMELPTEAIQETSEPQQSTEAPVDTPDASEHSTVSLETPLEDVQETSEPSAEPEKSTGTPVDASDMSEHSEASTETQDDQQEVVPLLSQADGTSDNVSETDPIGIEHT
jgi:phosphatidylglycerol:prolipoprotein diacylglycerol transferase